MLDPHEALHKELSDRYELAEVLGEGSMGTVYLARDRKHDRWVAIKTIHPERTNAEVRQRFQREIGITAQLQHPHILPLLDSGAAGETLYYVMPYVEGESLQSRLERDGRLSIEEAIPIAHDVAEALQHAHGRGVVHRDIKPGNIMLAGGNAVVTDFGIARAIAEAEGVRLTQTGLAIGSPAYMSPEQSTGERAADGRSDIYSLGCVLYEMLAGEPPFTGSTPLELIARSIREEAPPLRSKAQAVPPEVEGAVHKALAKAPEDRFQTAEAFAQALTGGREAAAAQALTAVLSGQQAGAHSFWSELRRRKVYNTAVLYALGAWILVQVAETTFPYLGLSDWAITIVIVSAIVGFPGALALAWAFDLTRKGIRRTGPVDVRAVAVAKASRRPWWRTGAAVAGAALLFWGAWLVAGRVTGSESRLDSIAVLPLENLTGNPELEYVADGLTEALIGSLGQISGLARVISRTSVMRFKETDQSLPEIGRALDVAALVEGSVRAYGEQLQIDVRLIEAETEERVWEQSFTRAAGDVLALQNEVAMAIARTVAVRLTAMEEARLTESSEVSPEGFDLYLRGLQTRIDGVWAQPGTIPFFEQAIAIDSSFAPAQAALAIEYAIAGRAVESERLAEKALGLNPSLSEAYVALGLMREWAEWDWVGAEAAFRRAIELNPGDAFAHHELGQLRMRQGRFEEALASERQALLLDPLNSRYQSGLGEMYFHSGRYDEAVEELERVHASHPSGGATWWLGNANWARGSYEEALSWWDQAEELRIEAYTIGDREIGRARYSAVRGERDRVLAVIDDWIDRGGADPYSQWRIAALYADLGEHDQAIDWLERAYESHYGFMMYVKVFPDFYRLHDEPRFRALLEKMGLD
jgi:serine/threonine-protein kinase